MRIASQKPKQMIVALLRQEMRRFVCLARLSSYLTFNLQRNFKTFINYALAGTRQNLKFRAEEKPEGGNGKWQMGNV